jgi:hypothetical protein
MVIRAREAELIRSEAQSKAKEIVKIAEEEAEKLIANSKNMQQKCHSPNHALGCHLLSSDFVFND